MALALPGHKLSRFFFRHMSQPPPQDESIVSTPETASPASEAEANAIPQAEAKDEQPAEAVESPPAKKKPKEKAKKETKAKDETEVSDASAEGGDQSSVSDEPPAPADKEKSSEDSETSEESEGRGKSGRKRASRKSSSKRGGQKGRQGRENKKSSEESSSDDDHSKEGEDGDRPPQKTRKQRYLERKEKERAKEAAALEAAPPVESEGIVEISPKGFGFLREKKRGFQQSPKDVFVTPEVVRNFSLRDGLWVKCISKQGLRGPQLIELQTINGKSPEEYERLPYFEELTAINPDKKLTLETDSKRLTTRVIDLVAPIGRGQRGLIVAPPRTGKTTLLHHIAEGVIENYDEEIHLMVLLVDERPEEVTDFQRSFPDIEVYSSSNDSDASDHSRISLLAIERAKRLVEAGEHVLILMDSITRLARAFNSQMRGGKGRGTASGGLTVGALEIPRRIFAAARNTREAGSLTIIATALIQTNSKADEAIFQEFKGTGNMELVLDRQLAQNYVYPAVDIHKSGTRREELLLPPHVLEKIYVIRRGLGGYKPVDAMEWLLRCMERYPSNAQMLMDIKTTALS